VPRALHAIARAETNRGFSWLSGVRVELGAGAIAREDLVEAIRELESRYDRAHGRPRAQQALDTYTAEGKVDYAAIHAARAFDPIVQAFADAKARRSRRPRMAFWINAYNALTIDLVADEWPHPQHPRARRREGVGHA
jgi:hypothetical protein